MTRRSCWVGALLAAAVLVPITARADKATFTVNFDTRAVATTLWYPEGLDVIRGVVMFTGGQGDGGSQDTRAVVDDQFWQRFAQQFDFALLGDQFTGAYTNADDGPGQGLLDALAGLGLTVGHPELAHAPLLVKGNSNGGYFSVTFTHFAASRVIAFCVNKSGYTMAPLDPPLLAVPGMLIWGSQEPATNTPTIIHSLVTQGRQQHALWSEIKEWGAAHEDGQPERLFVPFFAEMIAARYPQGVSPRDGDVPLVALAEASGWLGDHSDSSVESELPAIAAFADYPGDKQSASWLPSKTLALLWRGFVTKNPLMLSVPGWNAQLEVNQSLQLKAAGFVGAERASFLVGNAPLAAAITPNAGEASLAWKPSAVGVAAVIALAVDANGATTRTSRPADALLYKRPPPPMDAGAAGSSGMAGEPGGAGAGGEPAVDSGAPDEDAGMEPAAGGGGAGGEAAGAGGVGEAEAGRGASDASAAEPTQRHARPVERGASVSGGGCSASGRLGQRPRAWGACWAVVLGIALRSRRRRVVPRA